MTGGYIIVGCADGPVRGVLVAIDDTKIVIAPEVARKIAGQLIESADRIEMTGGASPKVEAWSREPQRAELEQIMRDRGIDPPKEPS